MKLKPNPEFYKSQVVKKFAKKGLLKEYEAMYAAVMWNMKLLISTPKTGWYAVPMEDLEILAHNVACTLV